MSELLLATANPGKQREFTRLLQGLPGRVVLPAGYWSDPGCTRAAPDLFRERRRQGSRLRPRLGAASLADDSGIEVAALDWGPGTRSARYGGPAVDDRAALILELLGDAGDRRARMVCWLALAIPGAAPDGTARSPRIELFSGVVEGEIATEQRGDGGFGYDPIFLLPSGVTTAELPEAEKDLVSHRGQAVVAALPRLRSLLETS